MTAPKVMQYQDATEVVEVWHSFVNAYLDAGYRLLAVMSTSYEIPLNKDKPEGAFTLRRRVSYVLGRTANTPHFDLPEREEKPVTP